MSAIAEVRLPSERFLLDETLSAVRDAEFHVVRQAAHDDGVMPLLWAMSHDREELYAHLDRDPTTEDVDVLAEWEARSLVRVEWQDRGALLEGLLSETDATILDATGRDGAWHLRLFCPESNSAASIHEVCEDRGVDVTLERISQLSDTAKNDDLGLTEEQYEAIRHAYETGYYDVPRKASQEELARSFDVSRQALSERLRRGHGTVIANTLLYSLDRTVEPLEPWAGSGLDG